MEFASLRELAGGFETLPQNSRRGSRESILILGSFQPAVCGKGKPAKKQRTAQFKLPIWLGAPDEGTEATLAASELKIIVGKSPCHGLISERTRQPGTVVCGV